MNIQEALNLSYKVHIGDKYGWYARVVCGELRSFGKKDDAHDSWVDLSIILKDKWQPYRPESTKCPACMEVEEIEKPLLLDGLAKVDYITRNHLRKYHCTCKEVSNGV